PCGSWKPPGAIGTRYLVQRYSNPTGRRRCPAAVGAFGGNADAITQRIPAGGDESAKRCVLAGKIRNVTSPTSTASLSGVARCWHSNAYFSLFSSLFFFDPPNRFVQIPRDLS